MALWNPNDPVAKGAVTYCLDSISAQANARERLEELRGAILALQDDEFRGLEVAFADHLFRGIYDADQIARITDYLGRYWFDPETAWWPVFQPIAPIYAHGLLQGLNRSLAVATPLPFDSYWLIGYSQVELINLVGPRQVTLLIATPTPPEPAPSGLSSETSQAWVTARRAGRSAQEVDSITGEPVIGDSDLRVRTFGIPVRRRPQS